MKIVFPKLTPWQQDVYKDVTDQYGSRKRFVVKSGRQRGKSFLLCILTMEYAIKRKCICVVIEPTANQCRRVHRQITDALEKTGMIKSSNASTLEIFLKNGSEIDFKSAESRDGIRGTTCTGLCVIDECAYISDDIIEIILPIINVKKCPLMLISSPAFASGYFYEQYHSDNAVVSRYDWALDKYDMSEYISPEMIEDYRQSYTPQRFKTEILGEFIKDESFVFGNFKECIMEPDDLVPVYAGIDFATGNGNDSTVVTFLNKSKQVIKIWGTNQMQPAEQIETIANLINSMPTLKKVKAEVNSLGEVYYSTIESKLKNKNIFEKFNTTNESKRRIIENLILAFQNHEIGILDDVNQINQLSYFQIKKTKTGYTYENDNASTHDDYVMSLAIAYDCTMATGFNGSFGFSR